MTNFREITDNGLWKQNPGLVQLLGLCPTLAVTTTAVNGFTLGLATALVMAASNASVAPIRKFAPEEIRIPIYVLLIAAIVTVIDLSMNAFVHPLHNVLGIFIPLIVTNCIVLARVESFAAKNPTLPAAWDGMVMGIGLAMVLTLLGAIREIVGKGTLLSGIDLVLGSFGFHEAKQWVLTVIPDYHGFLLAVLPPGAFIGLACLIAGKNYLDQRRTSAPVLTEHPVPAH